MDEELLGLRYPLLEEFELNRLRRSAVQSKPFSNEPGQGHARKFLRARAPWGVREFADAVKGVLGDRGRTGITCIFQQTILESVHQSQWIRATKHLSSE